MHNRRARPTLRVLREDLTSGWQSPHALRALEDDRLADLHPLSELPHPIIAKAHESLGDDPARDNHRGPIASATSVHLLEIRNSQWRGGVWTDPASGVRWLVAAGLAKGDHEDNDDFYERIKQAEKSGGLERWLPGPADQRLLKQETAARIRTSWELGVQEGIAEALARVATGGSIRVAIEHPVADLGLMADIELTVEAIRGDGIGVDEILVEFFPVGRFAGSDMMWMLITRTLITICPPVQGWDRFKDTYSNMGEPGAWNERVNELHGLVQRGELAVADPGAVSHYAHKEHIAGSAIEGRGLRALCGVFFVNSRAPDDMPCCPECQSAYERLSTD